MRLAALLVAAGVDVNRSHPRLRAPAPHTAAHQRPWPRSIALLLRVGADANRQHGTEGTALHRAFYGTAALRSPPVQPPGAYRHARARVQPASWPPTRPL